MVEYTLNMDEVFGSLADPTRRDILERLLAVPELSVSEVALPYDMSLAAISKHLKILARARLIIKRRKGKQQIVQLRPQTLSEATEYLERYRQLWEGRLDSLDRYVQEMEDDDGQ